MSVPVSFTIPGKNAQAFRDRLDEEALSRGISLSELVVHALIEYFSRLDNRKAKEKGK